MSLALKNLLTLLNLEKIEEGLFRGQSEDLGLRQVFGGQVVGQALYAAKETVPEERLVHSFHSYFLRPGDSQKPIIYDVEVLRDGNSFSARRVAAKLAAHHAQARKFARQGILLRKADLFKALRTARHHSGGDGGARLRRDGRKDDGGQVSGRVCGNIAVDHSAIPPML